MQISRAERDARYSKTDAFKDAQRRYRASEKGRAATARYRQSGKYAATKAAWRAANPGKGPEYTRRYANANPEFALWNAAKQRAKKAGLEFTITVADVIIPAACPYLGIPICASFDPTGGVRRDNRASLDRVDSRVGYVPGNVHVVSWKANRIKTDATIEDLLAFSRGFLAVHGGE